MPEIEPAFWDPLRPVEAAELVSWSSGIPYLTPEVQLLFKSKMPRPKDEEDFSDTLPLLAPGQRSWLRDVLRLTDPTHPRLSQL